MNLRITKLIAIAGLCLLFNFSTAQISIANNGLTASGSGNNTVSLGGTLNNAQTAIDFGSGNSSSNFLLKKGSSNYFFVDNNGNTGIGTATPSYKFHAIGTARFQTNVANGFTIGNDASTNYFAFDGTTGVVNILLLTSRNFSTLSNGASFFSGDNGSGPVNYVYFQNGAKLVGYQQPFTILRSYPQFGSSLVVDDDGNTGAYPSDYRIASFKRFTVEKAYIDKDGGGYFGSNVKIATLNTALTAPTTSGTTKMVITDANGQLSFANIPSGGTATLNSIAAATGTSTINNAAYQHEWQWNSLAAGTGLKLSAASTAAASNTQKLFEVAVSGANATASQTTYGAYFTNTHTGTSSSNVAAYFSASGGTNNYSALFDGGNVGIGTATPNTNAKLDVNGNIFSSGKIAIGTTDMAKIGTYALAVNGDAIFKKVKVSLYTSWPDYVFHKNYELLPLSEVEKFISINNHLPEVPSAKEIETNGIDLGDNQTILLKKIEELTLYIIQQQKEIEELKSAVRALKK
jgi:hypothetical protein